jgi:NAD(P)H dehydrogenase (quinone)
LVLESAHPNEFLHEIGISQSMKTIMLNDILGKRFAHKEILILGGTIEIE